MKGMSKKNMKKNFTSTETPALRKSLFSTWPRFEQDEIEAVTAVLKSGKVNYWTGEEGRSFEKEFAEFSGSTYAVALANGTVALELALYALGIGPGDEVITTSRTFIASASAVVMRGAKPVFADVDPLSQDITADTIREVISPKTRAIIPVHLAGWPCDMDPILELAREYGLKVIEDCAQAQGATYHGRPVGSLGDAAAFSFCQDKIMTTGGEGGMLTTNNEEVWRRAWAYKDHGKSLEVLTPNPHPSVFRWLHESFGTNWRMTEMQAAIGRVGLRKIPHWLEIRRRNARTLNNAFQRIPALLVPVPSEEFGHSYYKFYVFVRPERLKKSWDRDRIIGAVNAEGVPCFSGSCSEIYLEKAFRAAGFGPPKRLPVAMKLGETSLMFLVHPTLGEEDMDLFSIVVHKVLEQALV
jgi:dTDP-4-amino-4,6-dideoxygalactose transaminase